MTSRGSYLPGSGPDEPEHEGEQHRLSDPSAWPDSSADASPTEPPGTEPGNEGFADDGPDDDDHEGGWVDLEDRTWRHPSELHLTSDGSDGAETASWPPLAPAAAGSPRAGITAIRRHDAATLGVGAVAVVAAVVGLLLLVNAGAGPRPQRATTTGVEAARTATPAPCCQVGNGARQVIRSVVALESPNGRAAVVGCAIAVARGGLVVTTADAVGDARQLRAVTSSGRHVTATVVAVDRASDVALLRLPDTVPVPRVASDDDVGIGSAALTLAVGTDTGPTGRRTWTGATVVTVGQSVDRGNGAGMSTIAVSGRSLPDVTGTPLVDPSGAVMGMLDRSAEPDGTNRYAYLPMDLVTGVAADLARTGDVHHGWLDLEGGSASDSETAQSSTTLTSDPAPESGAVVTAVDPDGPSARQLEPGDVIVAIDGHPIRSMAELRTRLYVMAPGTTVEMALVRDGRPATAVIDLSASP